MSGNGNRYNAEFKTDAVRLVLEEGRSVISVSKDLGINAQTLRNWIKNKKRKQDSSRFRMDELERELKEKQKRIDELEESVDILKKAAALVCPEETK